MNGYSATGLTLSALALLTGCSNPGTQPDRVASTVTNAPGSTAVTHPITNPTSVNAPDQGATTVEATSCCLFGPVDAAISYVELKEELVAMTPTEADAAMREIAAPATADGLASSAVANIEAINTSAPAGLMLRIGILETKVISQTNTTATVAVWATQITTGAGAVRATYSTITHDLQLVDGRWLLSAVTQTSGPVPTQIQEPADPVRFESDLNGFIDIDTGRS